MRRLLPGLALCLFLAAPSAAQAAFAPRVQVMLDPSRVGTAPVITAQVSYDPGDPPAARLTLLFPPAFSLQAPEAAAGSELGSLEAVTPAGVHANGTIQR